MIGVSLTVPRLATRNGLNRQPDWALIANRNEQDVANQMSGEKNAALGFPAFIDAYSIAVE
jgi:hypothetical protein